MSIISRMRKQTAVYWPVDRIDDTGNPKYSDPIEISCRWEDRTEAFTDRQGQQRISNAIVYVDRELDHLGALFLGTLEDLTSQTQVFKNEGAYQIQRFDKLPNFRATEFLYTAYL